jgi:CO/xanthine dehydrogenase Mo-binding subunit
VGAVTVANVFARPERRSDAHDKLTGRARFTTDLRPAGALVVRYLSSTVPHGIVRRVSTRDALRVPGVVAVLTGDDARGIRTGRRLLDWPVLGWDRVRFVGDRIAAVAAETEAAAEAGVAALEVEIEELPVVLDAEDAIAPGAHALHPDAAEYRFLGGTRPPVSHPNIQGEVTLVRGTRAGDPDAFEELFRTADRVFEHTFTTGRQHQGSLERHAAIVDAAADGRIRVWTTNKSPFLFRAQMAAALDVPPESIDLDSGYIGGDFGSKGLSLDEYPCYLLSRATGRPVMAVATHDEELAAYAPRHGATIRLRSAVAADGRIVAHDADLLFDGGAYAAGKPIPPLIPPGSVDVVAPYDIADVRIRVRCVYTNTVPGGHMRCPGELQAVFAGESHIDLISRELGLDPLALRRINAVRHGSTTAHGEPIHEPGTLGRVLDTLEQSLPTASAGEGRGIAVVARKLEGGRMSIAARVAADGAVEIVTGLPDQGAGAQTVIRRVAAQALGVSDDRVRVVHVSTANAPLDIGVGASRVTFLSSRATLDAVEQLKALVRECAVAAGIDPEAGWDAMVGPEQAVGLSAVGTFDSGAAASEEGGHPAAHLAFGALAVVVSVDRDTGTWTIRDALFVGDVGTIINPVALAGQIDGGFAQGLGATMMEELSFSDGQVTTVTLADYPLPSSIDVPRLRTVLITDVPGPGAFGSKLVGELSPAVVAPAVAGAILDATGVSVPTIPITPERLLRALTARPAAISPQE